MGGTHGRLSKATPAAGIPHIYDTNFLLISSIKPELQLNLLVVGNLGAAVEHMQSEANLHLLIKFGIPRGFGN